MSRAMRGWPLLGVFGLFTTAPAWAVCPPTAGYTNATRPALATQPLDYLEFYDSCTNPLDCAHGIVTPSSSVAKRDELFVWLPGLGGNPYNNVHIANMAGYAGYRGIFLVWDNDVSVGEACAGATGLVGGACAVNDATDCTRIVRDELNTGRDDPTSNAYAPRQLDSVTHRLGMALNVEYALDTSSQWDWDGFCSPDPEFGTEINWGEVVIGGHSFGGNQATYISYRNAVAGAFIVDSGYDVCDADAPTSVPLADDVYDTGHLYNGSGEPARWYSEFEDESQDLRIFVFHEEDIFPTVVWPELPPSLEFMTTCDLLATPPLCFYDSATWLPTSGSLYSIEDPSCIDPTCWTDERFVSTNQSTTTSCGSDYPGHASVATDNCMPMAAAGSPPVNPVTGDSSLLHVFDTYVEALCSF